MSYDIYGNNLRYGYCEVHPHIHQQYPCSQCEDEAYEEECFQRSQYDKECQKEYDDYCAKEYSDYIERSFIMAMLNINTEIKLLTWERV